MAGETPSTGNERWQRYTLFATLFGSIATFLGVVVAIIGLIYVVKQLSLATESLNSAAYGNITTQLLELDKLHAENAELLPYFDQGKFIDSSHPKYNEAVAIADFQLDFLDSFLTQSDHLTFLQGEDNEAWRAWMPTLRIVSLGVH